MGCLNCKHGTFDFCLQSGAAARATSAPERICHAPLLLHPLSSLKLVDVTPGETRIFADETQRIGISYTGFCLTSLPHARTANREQFWNPALTNLGRVPHYQGSSIITLKPPSQAAFLSSGGTLS
jgi:hypothetical protein